MRRTAVAAGAWCRGPPPRRAELAVGLVGRRGLRGGWRRQLHLQRLQHQHVAHAIAGRRRPQHDAGETRLDTPLDTQHARHRQAGRVDAVQPAGVQQVAHLHIGVGRGVAQFHAALGTATEGRAALLRARVQHRNRGVLVGEQRHLGRAREHARHLAQHAGLVHHRGPAHHALGLADIDDDLARIGVGRLVQQLGRPRAHGRGGAQFQQCPQALVLLRQLFGAQGALGLRGQAQPRFPLGGLGIAQAGEVALAAVPDFHRHRQQTLHRQQQHRQRAAQRLGHLEADVGHHEKQCQRRKEDELAQGRGALAEERGRGAVERSQRHWGALLRGGGGRLTRK